MSSCVRAQTPSHGFTLTELAVVLVIVALMIGGLRLPLSAQDDIRRTQETQKTLNEARDALIGFAAANGRLPCPASGVTNGQESYCDTTTSGPCVVTDEVAAYRAHGNCAHFYDGYLPAVTLGISSVDSQGFPLDAWGNRIRYAVTKDPTSGTMSSNADLNPRYSFTMIDGMKSKGMEFLHPDLHVCTSGPASLTAECATTSLATSSAAVVFSTGRDGPTGGVGTDEVANINGDRVFVSHEPAPKTAANGEFDDIVVWLSPNILFNRMIAAGRLP